MGAAGAFAPANFEQRVHCNRPDEEFLKVALGRSGKEMIWAKTFFNFWDKMLPPLPLKHFMHPFC